MGGGIVQIRIPGPIPDDLTIFETMRAEADGRIPLWDLHRDRLRRGCAAVGFPLDEGRVRTALAGLPRGQVLRARLAVAADGAVALTHAPLPPNPPRWHVVMSPLRLDPSNPWLGIKSSNRPVYEAARAALPPGADEALLCNEDGALCEGTITNVFLRRGDRLVTPALACGLLPGVLRTSLLRDGQAQEAVLSPDDLRQGEAFCGNALRGLIPIRLI